MFVGTITVLPVMVIEPEPLKVNREPNDRATCACEGAANVISPPRSTSPAAKRSPARPPLPAKLHGCEQATRGRVTRGLVAPPRSGARILRAASPREPALAIPGVLGSRDS